MSYPFRYKNCNVNCAPIVLSDGRFDARATISFMKGPDFFSEPLINLGNFSTQKAAESEGAGAARKWIDAHF